MISYKIYDIFQLNHVPRKTRTFSYQMFQCSDAGISISSKICRFYLFEFWINANQIPFRWTLWQHSSKLGHPLSTTPQESRRSPLTLEKERKLEDVTELNRCGSKTYKLNAIPVWTISSNPTNALLTFCVDYSST